MRKQNWLPKGFVVVALITGLLVSGQMAGWFGALPVLNQDELVLGGEMPAPPNGQVPPPGERPETPKPPEEEEISPAEPDENGGAGQAVIDNNTVYLTFDDGPSRNTEKILDILKRYGVKATFFVIGQESEYAKSIYRRIVDEGHTIGNHTYSHNYSLIYTSVDNYLADTRKLGDLLYAQTGVRPQLIRFPGGSNNTVSWRYAGKEFMAQLVREVEAKGYRYVDWNSSGVDAGPEVQSRSNIVRTVLREVTQRHPTVILLHDGAKQTTTVEALPEIIESLQAKGYKFFALSAASYTVHF